MYFRCYDEVTGDVVYALSHPFKPASMKYFSGRLFCIGKGAMNVLDFTEATIINAQVCKKLIVMRHPSVVGNL